MSSTAKNSLDKELPRRGYIMELILVCIEQPVYAAVIDIGLVGALNLFLGWGIFGVLFLLLFVPVLFVIAFLAYMVIGSFLDNANVPTGDWTQYIVDKEGLLKAYIGKKVPIQTVQELYISGKVDLKDGKDFVEVWKARNSLFSFTLTIDHARFFINTLVKDALSHSQKMDKRDVGDVYNRGNDFYNWFLGDVMVYTSGIFRDAQKESLEDAQKRKMDTVCEYVQLREGAQHLDIGCGWGTFVCHAAKYYKSNSTGVTLAQEQVDWAKERARQQGVTDRVQWICKDYRDIPPTKRYDAITCLEMSEHVGIKNYQDFLHQVRALLKDDGIFYLQIAGLRRPWQYEDLVWGLFMDRYVFPGADASCPLYWVTNQLERAGFEVHRVENCGVHYAITIRRWYDNWISNRTKIVAKYGERWFRLWTVFLGWSYLIASQGSSTVFLITAHINHRNDKHSTAEDQPFSRTDRWIGQKVIATQQ